MKEGLTVLSSTLRLSNRETTRRFYLLSVQSALLEQCNSGWLSNYDLKALAIAMAAKLAMDAMKTAGKSLVRKLKRRKRGKLTRH